MRLSRRNLLAGVAGAVAAAATGVAQIGSAQERRGRRQRASAEGPAVVNDRIHQSVCEWCFTGTCSSKPMSLEQLCKLCNELGVKSVELVDPPGWPTLKKYNLLCGLANSHGFVNGFNDPANWEMCIDKTKKAIDDCAAAGFPNVICFPGFRHGIPDDVGLENTVKGLKKVVGYAEEKKINLILEVLNSRVDEEMKGHPDYMGDSVEWCVEVCKQIASERMKILFDVYHVQIMQGDIIRRIKANAEYIGHYHTAGNPGRNELDDNQEINYPPIMRTIVETGYQGLVAQEFIPTRDPATTLREAVSLCDV